MRVVLQLERHVARNVDLVQDDDLRQPVETRAVGGELAVDQREALGGVPLGRVDHVDEQPRPLEVSEELVAEADALARPLDQPRDVGDRQLPAARRVHGAENRSERRERVVGDLRLRVRDPAEQRRLAGVRQADERCVGHQLEPEVELELLAGHPDLGEPRRAARRRREPPVATPAEAAARGDHARTRAREVGDQLAVLGEQLRPHRDAEQDVLAVRAVLVRAPRRARRCRRGTSCVP